MNRHLTKGLVAAALMTVQLTAPAVDLDLYANAPPVNSADLPNVLFVIDNTANWNTAFTNEKAALKATFLNLPSNQFNIGIMFGAEGGGGNKGEKGAYVRAAVRTMNDANKAKYAALIERLDHQTDRSDSGAASLQMAEAWRYFSGGFPWAGDGKVKGDYAGNTSGGYSEDVAIHALTGNALPQFADAHVSNGAIPRTIRYNTPVRPNSCAKNYIIFISNGKNQTPASMDAQAELMLSEAGGDTAQIPISPSGSQSNPADEWARFMRKSSLGIVTYTIDVNPGTALQERGWTSMLKSMAGSIANYKAVTTGNGVDELKNAINDALSRIQSVNSVFAAVSLPASANVQGAYLNQLYVGMFRPDEDKKPRWPGNIKQYKMGAGGNLVDSLAEAAINDQTGFVKECAVSFWTPNKTSPDSYWSLDPKGSCIPTSGAANAYAVSNTPDGNIVEKGAQAYTLRGLAPAQRKVKTCATSACNAMADLSVLTATAADLGYKTTETDYATKHADTIRWARGQNVDNELEKGTNVMRPSAHGDVIHSNPLALSYGSDVVVFYGSNDGMLHAINGNQTANMGSAAPGSELWAFMPPEFFPHVRRLRENTEEIRITAAVGQPQTGTPKPYGIDGPITSYRTSTSRWLFATMRRGGRALYSFDVTDPKTPVLRWRVGCFSATNCTSTSIEGIGQTWSSPSVVRTAGFQSGTQPLLVMGGGYDECEDSDINTCTSANKGNNVIVLNATSGAVETTLPTDRAVIGEVRIIPDASGYGKYGYVGDLGGNLYRITMTGLPSAWTIVKIASLGCDIPKLSGNTCSDNRKFMFPASAVLEADGSVSLYIGSGDREKPLGAAYYPSTSQVRNLFFKVTDKPSDSTWLDSEKGNCEGLAVICKRSLSSVGDTDETSAATCGGTQTAGTKGWYLGLRATEQVVTLAATRFGVTTFSTHMPAVPEAGSCKSNLGTVHVYNLDITNAQPVQGSCSSVVKGGGLPPPPEKMDICMDANCSIKQAACIGCSTASPIEIKPDVTPPTTAGPNAKRRIYWYIQQ